MPDENGNPEDLVEVAGLGRYRKAITAVVAAGTAWATLVLTSAPEAITAGEWVQGAILLAGAVGVYGIPNE